METPVLVVTFKVGGVHLLSTDGTIEYKTQNFAAVMYLVSMSQMPVQVKYSIDPIVAVS